MTTSRGCLRSKATALVMITTLVLLTACQEKAPPVRKATRTSVDVQHVAKSDGTRELHLSGTLAAARSISLSFATLGVVERVLVEEGQAVKRGQVLATLRSRSFRDALGIARARAKQAQDAYRRLEPMYRNKTLPAVKMVEIEAGVEQARRLVSMAKKSLGDATLRAPVDGVVARRRIEPGSSAAPAMSAFILVQTQTILATAPVPEMQVAKITRGQAAQVAVPATGAVVEGKVKEIAVIANPLTRTYDIKVEVDNTQGKLRIGMIADVRVRVGGGEDLLVVPPEAVRIGAEGAPYVYVVPHNKKLEQRFVKVGGFVGEGTLLAKGVRAGELVVTSGTPMLTAGLVVDVHKPQAKAN